MKVLVDTNVILDVFLEREPFLEASSQIIAYSEQDRLEGWLCSTTITTIHYLSSKALTSPKAEGYIREVLKIFHISNVNRAVLEDALASNFKDYEDAVLYQSAVHSNLETIITRNQKDFKESSLPVYSPTEFLKAVDSLP